MRRSKVVAKTFRGLLSLVSGLKVAARASSRAEGKSTRSDSNRRLTGLQSDAFPLGYACLIETTNAGRGNRTPESSLEDSHVSVYITPASEFGEEEKGGAGLEPAASSFEATRSWFPFELTARGVRKVKVDGGTRTRVSDMASRRFSQLSYVHVNWSEW